uniref:Calcium-transporting ATPase n=1 Tax=Steinernema glaseri TaxID=37863 RepID=A0A1I7XW51_9BILA
MTSTVAMKEGRSLVIKLSSRKTVVDRRLMKETQINVRSEDLPKVARAPERAAPDTTGGGGKAKTFEVNLQELRKLMESRGPEAATKLANDYDGIEGLCRKLSVDPVKGLSNDSAELNVRRAKFGSNTIPTTKSKSFFRLVFDACKDPTLIILIIAGFLSLALSFSEPGQESSDHISAVNHTLSSMVVATKNVTEIANSDEKGDDGNHDTAWIEGVAIMICVIVVVLVTAANDYSKERQFRSLQAKIETGQKFSVVRDGKTFDVPVSDLVVGDVIRVKYGDLIPADGFVLQSDDLKIDESSLTGESDHIKKSVEEDPVLLSGTYAMEGRGKMLVTAVGVNSQTGIIMTLLDGAKASTCDVESDAMSSTTTSSSKTSKCSTTITNDSDDEEGLRSKSVLQTKLSKLALQIIYCGTSVATVALVVLVARFSITQYVIDKEPFTIADIQQFVRFFIIAVTILVISIPEGLPLAIALALSYSVRKMMYDNNLVRHLDACETMGNATTICSDKTGTLTTNQMTVVQSYINGHYYKSQEMQPYRSQLARCTADVLIDAISINSAYNSMIVEPVKPGEKTQQLGNKTECGLLGFVQKLGGNYGEVRRNHPEESMIKVFTFNSSRKTMITVIKLMEKEEHVGYRLFCKGASEIVIQKCAYFLGASGHADPFNEERQDYVVANIIQSMAEQGLRTICIAYKDFVFSKHKTNYPTAVEITSDEDVPWEDENEISSKLTGIAICGIQDPVRPEVPEAILRCKKAGITVRMVTGDNINTARAIAISCKILEPGEEFLAIEGKEFNERIRDSNGNVNQAKLDEIWPRLRVLARAQPADKYTLVKGIIQSKSSSQREIVAVTGDGTNDGPALKKADVGFAMGIAGTDVAKEASDIILTDDNFTSIVKAVMWGRNVYDSISKFLQFQLTVNVVAVTTAFISACTIADSPLKAVHMLWINLIMDTLASLALATEVPTEELLQRKPYGRKKSLISRTMVKNISLHAIYQLIILFTLLFYGDVIFEIESGLYARPFAAPTQHFTIVFNTFVMMTLFNEINSRKVHGERNVFKGLSSNHVFCLIWTSTFVAQILIVHIGGAWFSTAQLELNQWIACIGLGFSELIFGQLVATIPSKKLPKKLAYGRGEVHPSEIATDFEPAPRNRALQAHRTGRNLWMKGMTLFGIHFKVIRAFQLKYKNLGQTAPKMSAEAAERWRASYRRYKHKKHAEHKMTAQKSVEEQEADVAQDVPKTTLSPHERRLHKHIREIARPSSIERSRHEDKHT